MSIVDVSESEFAEQMAALWEFAESFRQDWPASSWAWGAGATSVFDNSRRARA